MEIEEKSIDVEEFVRRMKEELDKFERMWKKGEKENKDNFPKKMNRGDWDDQFLLY